MSRQPIRVLSLFSGIGAFEEAAEHVSRRGKAPIEVVAYAEIDPSATAIYGYHHPDAVNIGDVRAFAKLKTAPFKYDLLVAGFPCQDLSRQGGTSACATSTRPTGLKGARSGLFWDALHILRRDKPRYFLFENVIPKNAEDMDTITEELGVEPVEIDAQRFVPQRRRRLFWFNWDMPTLPRTKPPRLVDILDPKPPRALDHSATAIDYMGRDAGKGRTRWERGYHGDTSADVSPTLTKGMEKTVPSNVLIDRRFTPPRVRRYSPEEVERLFGFPDGHTAMGLKVDARGKLVQTPVPFTRRMGLLGNSIVVPVLEHVLKGLP
jgi:site-specific DNA-cytosine methylase